MLGFMSLTASGFWLSLFMQRVQNHSPLGVAVRLLPQAIAGILVNIVAGLTLHHVSNKMLIGIGTLSYTISALLLALMKADSMYWAFIFPSLIFSVIGADMQFNVANVSSECYDSNSFPYISVFWSSLLVELLSVSLTHNDYLDVRHVLSAAAPTIPGRWCFQHRH